MLTSRMQHMHAVSSAAALLLAAVLVAAAPHASVVAVGDGLSPLGASPVCTNVTCGDNATCTEPVPPATRATCSCPTGLDGNPYVSCFGKSCSLLLLFACR